ncbi:hypothetical protein GUITHDRAFT_114349 [Guillardia theta CCMP2712]|uniref:Hemolysin III n=1 Tax=Guillardia theta (strain CCMP2712) TaxID=905079 RepID=L1IU29_GUITC|nr:hypothetical protein GUITHDRAFT_114349 [Guillardia theta CCMP2712]EKX39622.1 hypothetical protein GUITHDRAFT_114349 [Guillardia theta CCMP2712]|eukprot:XP_005826602.1 hypothetical protein GUITHDRAFT_114349 [Guillardia theta CCMP2712]
MLAKFCRLNHTFHVPVYKDGPDWFSFWTHALGFVLSLIGLLLLVLKASTPISQFSCGLYGCCMCVLFFASALHHMVKRPAGREMSDLLRRFDHISIYLFIAGSYVFQGWICLFLWTPLHQAFSPDEIHYLVAGGLLYTLGAFVYATKFPDPLPNVVGFHGLWHLFVLLGASQHFWFIYKFVA